MIYWGESSRNYVSVYFNTHVYNVLQSKLLRAETNESSSSNAYACQVNFSFSFSKTHKFYNTITLHIA